MKTSAIIVTYNKKESLMDSLHSLFNLNGGIYKVIVINNNSSDGTSEYLDSIDDDRLIYKNLEENIGGAGGFSKGLEVAYEETTSDYFWLMDDDAIADPNSLEMLVKTAKEIDNKFGFLSSNVSYESGEGTNCPKTIDGSWNVELKKHGLIKVVDGTFVSLFIKRSTVKKVGLPISEMFIWGDDIEYTTRITNNISHGSYFVMDSNITHMSKNVSTNIYNCPRQMLKRYRYMFRNFIYIDIHNRSFKDFVIYFLRNIVVSINLLFKSKNNRFSRFCTIICGTFAGLFFHPQIKFPKDEK